MVVFFVIILGLYFCYNLIGSIIYPITFGYDDEGLRFIYLNAFDSWKDLFKDDCNLYGKILMILLLLITLPMALIWTIIFVFIDIVIKLISLGFKSE